MAYCIPLIYTPHLLVRIGGTLRVHPGDTVRGAGAEVVILGDLTVTGGAEDQRVGLFNVS